MVVLDASVIVKCYVPEEDSDKAEALYTGSQRLFAPEILRYEVLGALSRRVRVGTMDAKEARSLCRDWQSHLATRTITLIDNQELLEDALDASLRFKHGLMDCFYLAAAQMLRAPLITADETFHKRCHGHYKKLQLLAKL